MLLRRSHPASFSDVAADKRPSSQSVRFSSDKSRRQFKLRHITWRETGFLMVVKRKLN